MLKKTTLQKDDKHELLYRKGYFLPPLRSPAVTHDYLDGVDTGEIFCPKFFDVKLRGCYRPPTKELIFEEVKKLMDANNFNWGIKDAGKVPKEWMLTILATISPEHEYFDPSFTQ